MSGAPTTPGRRRREREEPYIPFNHDPKNFGTRTGVAMPKNVPRDSAGFEDASYFFPPLPPAPDSDDRVTTYSRRTPGTGKTMRTSVGPSTNGRPSTGMTSRRKRMSDLGGDEPDDTFAQGDANMLVDDDFADDDIRVPTAVPLPPSSRRADRTPGASKEAYAELPSPSVGSPSTRRSTATERQSKHGLSSRLSASVSPQKRRSTTTAHSRLSAITANTTVDTDELGDALAIDESLVETEMIVGGEEDIEEGEGEGEEGTDAGALEEEDVEVEDRSRAQAKAKGKGKARSTLGRREANEQDAEEQDEDDPSEEVPRKSRLSTKSTRSLANDESDGEGDRTRASLAPSLRLGDVSFGAADLETDEYGNDTMDDIGPSRHDHADNDGNEEGEADDDVGMEQDAMDEEGLDEIPEEQDEEQDEEGDEEGDEDEETLPVKKTAAKGKAATKAKTRPPPAKSRAQREESVTTREKREAKRKRLSNFPNELDGNGWQGDFQTRRSGRQHIKPLEYWRGEKVEYGKGQHQAVIKEVVTIPQDPVVPLAARHKRGAGYRNGNRGRSKSRRGSSAPPIEDWDLETEQNGMVNNFITNEEEEKRIVFPSHMRKTKLVQTGEGGHFGYQKTFGDDFHASGYVEIQPGQEKPSKPSRDNAYTFCVLEGVANVCIHRTSFVVAKHGQFEVPRGNEYKITNIHTTPLLIFFSQSRKVRATSEEIAAHDAQIAASQAGAQSQRRESNAPAPKKKSLPNGQAKGKGKGKRAPDPDEQETEQEDDAEEGEEEEEEVVVPKKKVKSR